MGEAAARYAVEMATVIAGDGGELRRRPVLSLIVCTVAPLVQEEQSLESAMVLAEAGVPVALATDFNPGSCYTESMPMILTLAVLRFRKRLD